MTATTTAATTSGTLRGVTDGAVVAFRGIPYPCPPLGPFRFAPPQRPEPWPGVRAADTFGPTAMQATNAVRERMVVAPMGEDCLSLNVWTPAVDADRRPVLVWLHGGAFLTGAGSMPMYRGAALARRGDVVVVTVNYRLGLFGYLRGIDVCGEALPSTGNAGLLDQLAALTWVREEIAAFGGDPENVTVFGQSAGAHSIGALLAMPRARGLFHKAILQSGTAVGQPPARANQVMERILADVGLAPHEAGKLRNLPAAELLEVQTRVTPRAAGAVYHPVADGEALPTDPNAAIAAGSAAGIPLLVGTNLEEWRFFHRLEPDVERLTDDGLLARLVDPPANAQRVDDARFDPAEVVAVYRRARNARGESTTAHDLWIAIMSDRRFRVPMLRLAECHAVHTPQTFAYLFTWRSPAWDGLLGAGHVVEVPFVFGTLDAPDARDLVPASAAVGDLSARMQDAWIAFARTGNPQTAVLPDWESYTASRRSTMLLGATSGTMDAPHEAERRFRTDQSAGGIGRQIPVA